MSVTITRIKIAGDQTGNVAEVDASNHLLVTSASQGPVTPGTAATSSTLVGGQYNAVLPTLTDTQQSSLQLDSRGRLVTVADRTWNLDSTTDNVGAVQFGTWAFILKNPSGNADYNFGTVGILTLRTAAIIGNATGAANFNYGTVGAQTLRTASQIGNATGAADFGAGATGAQTLRVTANQGTSPWVTSSSNFPTTLDTNYGTVGASTLRTAAQIGNATGAALFGAGTTTAQVLRVVLPTDQTAIPVTQSGTWLAGSPDKTAFTYGTTLQQTIGGVFQDTSPSLTAGQEGAVRLTTNRAMHVNLRDSSSNELLNQKAMSGSIPVVVASDQTSIPVKISDAAGNNITLGQKAMASSLPIVIASDQLSSDVQGSISALNGTVAFTTVPNASQFSTAGVNITGTWVGTLVFEQSWDNSNWFAVYFYDAGLRTPFTSTTVNGNFVFPCGSPYVRIRASAWTSGSAFNTLWLNWGNNTIQAVSPSASSFNVTALMKDGAGTSVLTDFGASANALRVAALLGNSTGAASFNAGATSAQTLRTASNLYDGSGNSLSSNAGALFVVGGDSAGTFNSSRVLTTQGAGIGSSPIVVYFSNGLLASSASIGTVQPGNTANTTPWLMTINQGGNSATVTAAGALKVDGSAVTQPISGTVAVTQSTIPWTVQGASASGATSSGSPVHTGGVFNTTQPTVTTGQTVSTQMTARGSTIVATGVDAFNVNNITGTVSLPTGAATAANQSTEITSLQLLDNVVGSVSPGTAATASTLIGGVFNSTLPTLTNGQQASIQLDDNGRVLVIDATDAGGRNQTNYWMAAQILSTATDALMSLTGYKSGAAVGATTTPAVVTAAKVFRIISVTIDYTTIITTPGSVRFTLRANTGGTVVIGSPAVCTWEVGEPTGIIPVAGKKNTVTIPMPDGIEFKAGTGIGISMVGLSATGAAAVVGYGRITINGFEY